MNAIPKPYELHAGDARHIPIVDETVQCIVTSPPYWGLRKYAGEQELIWLPMDHPKGSDFPGMCPHAWKSETRAGISGGQNQGDKTDNPNGATNRPVPPSQSDTCARCGAWRGAFGLEPTIEMYVAHTLEILRECRRVLRPDGVLFWNLGDSYAANRSYQVPDNKHCDVGNSHTMSVSPGLKPKDLCLIPARVAIAAQADGWWIRSMIIWTKPNPMPESVTDRPTDAYEHILMLTKSERYFWDADAVREVSADARQEGPNAYRGQAAIRPRGNRKMFRGGGTYTANQQFDADAPIPNQVPGNDGVEYSSRNLRNVWDFATQPYPEAHFATFPEELPRRCIRAATSERGACSSCGAPWERIRRDPITSGKSWNTDAMKAQGVNRNENPDFAGAEFYQNYAPAQTIGWSPTCRCPGQHGKTSPHVVLDPFTGSGTTGKVAMELGRKFVGMDLAYHELSRERIESGIPGTDAWIRRKNGVRRVPHAILPLFEESDAANKIPG